jgi:hypothetical protein
MMSNDFALLNNAGAHQLENGIYVDAIDSFTASLRIVKNALQLAADETTKTTSANCQEDNTEQDSPVAVPRMVAMPVPDQPQQQEEIVDACSSGNRGLFLKPLRLVEDYTPGYECYEPWVEASVAIMFNLALAHHLNSIFGSPLSSIDGGGALTSTLDQTITLYELAYTVHMQEDSEISVEFTMAIINNLGHAHKFKGDEEKSNQCFRHLLSTILFLQSYGQSNSHIHNNNCTEQFVYSIAHLIFQKNAAPAA